MDVTAFCQKNNQSFFPEDFFSKLYARLVSIAAQERHPLSVLCCCEASEMRQMVCHPLKLYR